MYIMVMFDSIDGLGVESRLVFILTTAVTKEAPWGRFQHQHLSKRGGSHYSFHQSLLPNTISCREP